MMQEMGSRVHRNRRSYAIDSWIYVQQHLCTNETEVIGYLNAILEKESNNNCILNCLYGKYSFGEKNVLNEILNYIKNTDYHIRYWKMKTTQKNVKEK